ncbi:MAG: hypothetical protein ACR5LD_01635 [Symbiopectobacterium sp.]
MEELVDTNMDVPSDGKTITDPMFKFNYVLKGGATLSDQPTIAEN